MRTAAVLAVALVLLAGCSADSPATGTGTTGATATTGSSSATGSCPPGERWLPPHCVPHDGAAFAVRTDAALRLEVPLPHLDRCVAPQEWAAANATVARTAWSVRAVNRGHVLYVESDGPGMVELQLDLAGRPTCQTFRNDPWSVDPDPAEGTLDVNVLGGAGGVLVTLRHQDGHCHTASSYNGTVSGQGWRTLDAILEGQRACA